MASIDPGVLVRKRIRPHAKKPTSAARSSSYSNNRIVLGVVHAASPLQLAPAAPLTAVAGDDDHSSIGCALADLKHTRTSIVTVARPQLAAMHAAYASAAAARLARAAAAAAPAGGDTDEAPGGAGGGEFCAEELVPRDAAGARAAAARLAGALLRSCDACDDSNDGDGSSGFAALAAAVEGDVLALSAAIFDALDGGAAALRDEEAQAQATAAARPPEPPTVLRAKLEVVTMQTCPKWHADAVGARALITYAGPGTLFVPDAAVERRWGGGGGGWVVAGVDESSARQAAPFECLYLKGGRFPGGRGAGAVHKSPPTPAGAPRLVLTVDDAAQLAAAFWRARGAPVAAACDGGGCSAC